MKIPNFPLWLWKIRIQKNRSKMLKKAISSHSQKEKCIREKLAYTPIPPCIRPNTIHKWVIHWGLKLTNMKTSLSKNEVRVQKKQKIKRINQIAISSLILEQSCCWRSSWKARTLFLAVSFFFHARTPKRRLKQQHVARSCLHPFTKP